MIYATIYRDEYDSHINYFYGSQRIFIANTAGPFEPKEGDKVGMLIQGHQKGNVILVPATFDGSAWVPKRGGMAGGTFAYTSDSRFSDALEGVVGYRFYGAVSIHDRFENGL